MVICFSLVLLSRLLLLIPSSYLALLLVFLGSSLSFGCLSLLLLTPGRLLLFGLLTLLAGLLLVIVRTIGLILFLVLSTLFLILLSLLLLESGLLVLHALLTHRSLFRICHLSEKCHLFIFSSLLLLHLHFCSFFDTILSIVLLFNEHLRRRCSSLFL